MMTRPSSRTLLECVQRELHDNVAPAVTDDHQLRTTLEMIHWILGTVIRRIDCEVMWIEEEIAEIVETAEAVISSGADSGDRVGNALQTLQDSTPSKPVSMESLYDRYRAASEVLSCSLEASFVSGGELAVLTERVLEKRLAREVEIRGEYLLAGRS